jgi:hypothetical protein
MNRLWGFVPVAVCILGVLYFMRAAIRDDARIQAERERRRRDNAAACHSYRQQRHLRAVPRDNVPPRLPGTPTYTNPERFFPDVARDQLADARAEQERRQGR